MSTKKQKYSKKDFISHCLDRPDTWVGSIRSRQIEDFVSVDEGYTISKRKIDVSPAIIRMFIEPLSNVIDNVARSKQSGNKTTKICIDIDKNTGKTSFWNDGEVVPIELHPEEKCYNHTMIFGQILTGSNYDDEEDREDISGRNGIGCKAVNVFSKEFSVEGVDPKNKKHFIQTWENNMRNPNTPDVTKSTLKKGYTKVTYTLDFARFGLEGYTQDILDLYKKYSIDTAMITKIPVFFNGEEIPVKSLSDYARLYQITETSEILSIKTLDCEVVLTPSEGFEAISFANGIFTPLGGTHVDPWCEAIFRPLVQKLNKPKKPQLNIADVKGFFRIFVVATVKKPEFDSQSKFKLESPVITPVVKKTHISAISKWSVMERMEDIIRAKEMIVLKKSERKKRGYEKVDGLEPANNEGGKRGHECTLILVEGLSAKTYASCGIQKGAFGKAGRDFMGIYPLRGKVLNTRNSKPLSVSKNKVVSDIIKALGIQYGLDYTLEENYKKLRYGRVMILTDADTDGIHISALLQNLFHSLFPSLLLREEAFVTSMQTPIVRVYLGKSDILFYDEQEYKNYVQGMDGKKINKKYYKGLASSNEEDVLETFGQKLIKFSHDEKCTDTMNKAFHTKHADSRKKWLEQYDPMKTVLKWTGNTKEEKDITFSDFIDTELIKFSIDDCARSIPNLMDGLKQGHRKVLYVCFLRNLKYSGKTIKVSQLAGSVSEKSGYHHGEVNLHMTITHMASSYVGSNNIPLLYRDGQFGSRAENGKDAGDGRYIWTKLDMLTRLIFRPEDDVLLDYLEDDGEKVEPAFYVPIIPMVLVNGIIVGIGTGWSCSVPGFNPLELISAIKVWLENDGKVLIPKDEDARSYSTSVSFLPELKPWYRGHTGPMVKEGENKFVSWGRVEILSEKKSRVVELPVSMATSDFVESLEKLKEEKKIANYKNHCPNPKVIDFTITETEEGMTCNEENLKLSKSFRTSNMVLFSEEGLLKKYNTVDEIIDGFCKVRYEYYVKRKKYILNDLEKKIKYLGNKKRFLEAVRDGEIKLFDMVNGKRQSRKTVDIISELEEKKYDKEGGEDEGEDDEEDSEDPEEEKKGKTSLKHGYEYLLRLQISSITAEKINKLKRDIESNVEQRDELQGTSEKDLWIKDLDEFEVNYEKFLKVMETEKVKTKKKK